MLSKLIDLQPYVFTGAFCLFNTWYSDRTSKRSPHMIYPSIAAIVGIIITIATTNTAARYTALFLMLPGTYGCFQISNAWMANIAARPRKKRAIALAMNNSLGNTALVWTPYLYLSNEGPRYIKAWSVNLALSVIVLVSSIILSICLRRDNKKIDNLEINAAVIDQSTVKEASPIAIEHAGEHATAGRQLGGTRAGMTARYDT